MEAHTIAVDCAAFVLAVIGFHMVFRQRFVRRLWRRLNHRPPRAPSPHADEDPTHYAMIISGMMLLAFALILATMTTAVDLMTP